MWVETRVQLPEHLYPAELHHISRAVLKRREEFATVRACARRALGRLGVDRPALVPGRGGEPPWPDGFVGSMTHTDGYCAAAVARRTVALSLGIDAEPNEPLPEGVVDLVTGPDERARLAALTVRRPDVCWDRLVFSAKESVFKTWYPVMATWLGFEDVDLRPDPRGTFSVTPVDPAFGAPGAALLAGLRGRWQLCGSHLVTGALVPPSDSGR